MNRETGTFNFDRDVAIKAMLSQEARGRYQVHDPMVSPIYPQITVLSPVSDV
jgi:hypothetical protein